MKITRLSLDGYGARRAGSFANKTSSTPPAPPPPPPPQTGGGGRQTGGGHQQAGRYAVYLAAARKRRKEMDERERLANLREMYRETVASDEQPAAVAAVQHFIRGALGRPSRPPVQAIDWRALSRDLDAVEELLEAWVRAKADQDDEDDAEAIMLLH